MRDRTARVPSAPSGKAFVSPVCRQRGESYADSENTSKKIQRLEAARDRHVLRSELSLGRPVISLAFARAAMAL